LTTNFPGMCAFRSEVNGASIPNRYRRAGRRSRERSPAAATLHHVGPTSFPQLLIAVTLAGAISMGTFAHADRHGSTHATAWGVGAFLAAGVVVPVYFIRYWLRKRRPAA